MRSDWEQEIAVVIGTPSLVKLEAAFGGQYIYIKCGEPSSEVVNAVGYTAAKKLSDWYAGSDIYVPLVALRRRRNLQILNGRNTGKPIAVLASEFGLSTRRIREIIKGAAA